MHREHLGWSYERIGEIIGKKHDTVLRAYHEAAVLMHEEIEPFYSTIRLMEQEHGY